MNREERDRLSHHEQLRYDYLLANLSYLNATEQEEFAQLSQKAQKYSEETAEEAESELAPSFFEDGTVGAVMDGEVVAVGSRAERSRRQKPSLSKAPRLPRVRPKKSLFFRRRPSTKTSRPKPSIWRRVFGMLKWTMILLLVLALTMIGFFVKGMQEVTADPVTYPPTVKEVFHGQGTQHGTNILILGSDQRVTQGATEARTDTVMVMNLSDTGQIKLVSFMRDTLVNIEGLSDTPDSLDSKINTAFTIGEQNNHQGAELMRQTLKRNFGIDIQYYALIDFQTFAVAIDTLFPGGVTIDAQFATVNGVDASTVEVPDDLGFAQGGSQYQTLTEGLQKMDGKTLLNYARFRGDDEADFGRTKRQQEVIAAVMSQVKNPLTLFSGAEALGKVYALMSTDVPLDLLLSQIWPMLTGQTRIERATIPELGDWTEAYDRYGGLGLEIDLEAYGQRLADLGLR